MEKFMQARTAVALALFSGLMLVAPGANASPDPTETAITGLGTKVGIYGAAIVAVVVIAIGFTLGVKYLRRAANKA